MEPLVVPDAVFVHEGGLKNNMSAALVSTQEVLKIAVTKLQHLAASLPQAGNSAVEYIRPILNLIIDKINANSVSLGNLYTEMAELTSVQQAAFFCLEGTGKRIWRNWGSSKR